MYVVCWMCVHVGVFGGPGFVARGYSTLHDKGETKG